jgi:uncharacterized tellurite resistance protein B-like protein
MFEKLKQLMSPVLVTDEADTNSVPQAAAMLLLEVAWADHEIKDVEFVAIRRALQELYTIDDAHVDALIQQAHDDHELSTGVYPFTRTLNKELTREEKCELLKHLWRLTNFEGDRHHYEEHVIRKITDLLYLNHRDFITAKLATIIDGGKA